MNDPLTKQISKFASCVQKLRQYNLAVSNTATALQSLPGAKARENGSNLSKAHTDHGVPIERNLKNIVEKVQQEAAGLKQQVGQAYQDIDKLQDDNRVLKDDLDSLEVSLQSKRKEIRRLESENAVLQERIQRRVPDNSEEIIDLKAELRLIKKDKLKLEKTNKKLREEQTALQEKIEELDEEVGLIKKCKQCQKKEKHRCVIRGGEVSFPKR